MNPGCDSMKNRRSAACVASIYAHQDSVSNEVCHVKILSINQFHEVTGNFLASVSDRNEMIPQRKSGRGTKIGYTNIHVQVL